MNLNIGAHIGHGAHHTAKKEKQTETGGAVMPRGIGDLGNYSIQWSMETAGRDPDHGGQDFKRIEVTGKLMFTEPIGGWAQSKNVVLSTKEEVGSIKATQYRLHHMGNSFTNAFDVFDKTQEGMEVYNKVIKPLHDDCMTEEMSGDALVIERIVLTSAHHGHQLGLFMIEAADTVINGHMSVCIIKPYPLQFEVDEPHRHLEGSSPETCGVAQAQLSAYYRRLGFHQHDKTPYMIRWNGRNAPSLDVMSSK